jgi:hypothetical protein
MEKISAMMHSILKRVVGAVVAIASTCEVPAFADSSAPAKVAQTRYASTETDGEPAQHKAIESSLHRANQGSRLRVD